MLSAQLIQHLWLHLWLMDRSQLFLAVLHLWKIPLQFPTGLHIKDYIAVQLSLFLIMTVTNCVYSVVQVAVVDFNWPVLVNLLKNIPLHQSAWKYLQGRNQAMLTFTMYYISTLINNVLWRRFVIMCFKTYRIFIARSFSQWAGVGERGAIH